MDTAVCDRLCAMHRILWDQEPPPRAVALYQAYPLARAIPEISEEGLLAVFTLALFLAFDPKLTHAVHVIVPKLYRAWTGGHLQSWTDQFATRHNTPTSTVYEPTQAALARISTKRLLFDFPTEPVAWVAIGFCPTKTTVPGWLPSRMLPHAR